MAVQLQSSVQDGARESDTFHQEQPLKYLFASIIIWFLPVFAAGADPIRGEFWVKNDLLEIVTPGENIREAGSLSEREEKELNVLLEDARWVFSGMIYGFTVRWTPSSAARDVDDDFLIEPLALIPRGDPRMRTVSLTRENGFLYVLLEYSPDTNQEGRLEGWNSGAFPAATGSGLAAVNYGSRRDAIEAAVKETLRAWLRVRDYNRPREIQGRVAFLEFPLTQLRYGSIRAVVTLGLDLEPLRHYAAD